MESNDKNIRWIKTVITEMSKLEGDKGTSILNECGKECSKSFGSFEAALKIYNEAPDKNDIDYLIKKFNEDYYKEEQLYKEEDTIYLIYPECYCPIVKDGVENPFLCNCTIGYTKSVYETLFGRKVNVDLQQSILRGDKICKQSITIVK